MAISNNFTELIKLYHIKAVSKDGQVIDFENDTVCNAFIIKNKIVDLEYEK